MGEESYYSLQTTTCIYNLPEWRNGSPAFAGRQARFDSKSIIKLKSMYVVYAIKSIKRNYIYVGMTNDIIRRYNEHNTGREKTTRPYAPFVLLYTEQCSDRVQARVREKYLKSGVGKEFLKSI